MATLALEPTGTDIVVAVQQNPGIVLLDTGKFDVFYDKLRSEAPADADVTTRKGQEALRSFAAKVRSEKAAIDKARLRLTAEWRDMTSQANAAGKQISERLEGLAVEVRAPLTAWEDAEKARVAECRQIIDYDIKMAAHVALHDTAASVRQRGTDVWGIALDLDKFGDMLAEAQSAKDETIATLKAALVRLEREEADAAELARLRAENEAREARERDEQEERDRKAREAENARIAEERRVAAEKAEADRIAAAERAAADAEREKLQRAHEETLAAERAAAQAEMDRIARGREMLSYIREVVAGRIGGQTYPFGVLLRELETKVVADDSYGDMRDEIEQARIDGLASLNEAMERQAERNRREEERVAEEARMAEERERQENKAHRAKIMKAAKEAIMTCGADEETAKKVVLLIRAGEVPNVTLRF